VQETVRKRAQGPCRLLLKSGHLPEPAHERLPIPFTIDEPSLLDPQHHHEVQRPLRRHTSQQVREHDPAGDEEEDDAARYLSPGS
jgi:hypothetical protein